MACIFVDIDGTLIGGPSCEGRFALYLLKRGRLGPYQLARAAAFVPRGLIRYGRHVFKKNKAYLAGLGVEAVAGLAGAFVDEVLVPRLRRRLIERLEIHKSSGETIVLLTGAPDFIARPLGERLGADDWCATKCVAREGVYTADPPAVHPFAEAKLEFAAGHGPVSDPPSLYQRTLIMTPAAGSVGRATGPFGAGREGLVRPAARARSNPGATPPAHPASPRR